MSNIPQQPGSLALSVPLTYDIETNVASATHFSHAGVGGFIELPTLESRNSIPTHSEGVMHVGGLSSGRRKLGMIVFIQETNKFYQLIPRIAGVAVTFQEWQNKSDIEKVLLLDPARAPIYDEIADDFIFGSGNPDEPWTEVFVNKGWEEKTNEFAPTIIPPFSPKRPVYFVADSGALAPGSEGDFDSLVKDFDLSDGSVFGIQVGTNVKRIVIAYPSAYGDLTRVIDSSTGFNIIGSFNKTTFLKYPPLSTDFNPPNNDYDGLLSIEYNIYTSILAVSYSSPTVYTVTI